MDRDILLLIVGAGISLISSVTVLVVKHWLDRRMEIWKEERLDIRIARDRRLSKLTEKLGIEDPTELTKRFEEYRGRLRGLLPELDGQELDHLDLLLLDVEDREEN
jgi:hypothetical protein